MANLGQLNFDQLYKLQYIEYMEREVVRLRTELNEYRQREYERQRAEFLAREAYWRNPGLDPYAVAANGWNQMYTVTGRMNGKKQALENLRRGPLRFEEAVVAEPEDPYAIYRNMWAQEDHTFQPLAKTVDGASTVNRKALELFQSRLTQWQRETFDVHGCIDVKGPSGNWWRIDTMGSISKNVLNMATMTRYCFYLRDYNVPRFDHFTAQAVLIGLDDTKISQYPAQAEETIIYRRKIDSLYPVKENA